MKQAKDLLDEIKARGGTVNPNIEITPETTAEFMKIAEKEIDPYYTTQLKLAREGFLSSVGYDADQVAQSEKQLQAKYG